jgi:hypothetical protein
MTRLRLNQQSFIFFLCAATLTLALVSCQPPRERKILEGRRLQGFEQVGSLTVYNKTTLFDFMDGEAETYFPFGFRLLYTQIYGSEKTDARMVVEIYDMTTAEGSASVYKQYRAGDGSIIQGIGESAWTDRWLLLLRQGSYFIRISPDPSTENTVKPTLEDMIALAREIDVLLR